MFALKFFQEKRSQVLRCRVARPKQGCGQRREKSEAKGGEREKRTGGGGRRCRVIFVNLTGPPFPPTFPIHTHTHTPCCPPRRPAAAPARTGSRRVRVPPTATLPVPYPNTSAPGSLPPSPRRSEVNRRRGPKTTPTLSRKRDPPYHGYSISFHYAPCAPPTA